MYTESVLALTGEVVGIVGLGRSETSRLVPPVKPAPIVV